MENASKALLIAGGVLIALIIITLFIMMSSRLYNMAAEQEEEKKIEQITAFNDGFEAYNKKVMYGADVITLINKAAENNKKYSEDADKISIILDGVAITDSSSLVGEKENYIYKCERMEYNANGKVCKIIIITK